MKCQDLFSMKNKRNKTVVCYKFSMSSATILTLVLLNPDVPCFCKQCRSRSVGFWRRQMIWICTVCHQVCEFVSKIWIKKSDWLKIRNGCGILIYSAGQGLNLFSDADSIFLYNNICSAPTREMCMHWNHDYINSSHCWPQKFTTNI